MCCICVCVFICTYDVCVVYNIACVHVRTHMCVYVCMLMYIYDVCTCVQCICLCLCNI